MALQRNTHRRQRDADPKLLKKHSDIQGTTVPRLLVAGKKTQTETGYRIDGYRGKQLETYYECFLSGAAGPLLTHPKKDRVMRVLAGFGILCVPNEPDRRLHAGDEVILVAGSTYRLSTVSGANLEVHVTQDSGYDKRLIELEPASALVTPTDAQLRDSTDKVEGDYTLPPRRKDSRAKELRLALHSPESLVAAGGLPPGADAPPGAVDTIYAMPQTVFNYDE